MNTKFYLLVLNDGLGRTTEIGLFTNMEKVYKYESENQIGIYESYEVKELQFIE